MSTETTPAVANTTAANTADVPADTAAVATPAAPKTSTDAADSSAAQSVRPASAGPESLSEGMRILQDAAREDGMLYVSGSKLEAAARAKWPELADKP